MWPQRYQKVCPKEDPVLPRSLQDHYAYLQWRRIAVVAGIGGYGAGQMLTYLTRMQVRQATDHIKSNILASVAPAQASSLVIGHCLAQVSTLQSSFTSMRRMRNTLAPALCYSGEALALHESSQHCLHDGSPIQTRL